MLNDLKIVDNTSEEPMREVGIGATLKSRFVLEELLATGGMGSIYKARDLRKEEAKDRDSRVAIKVLSDEFRHHPEAFVALQRESRRIQNLSHPNIITVYDFDRDGDIVFMTMEYLEGMTLDKVIKNPTIELSPQRVMRLSRDIAAALERAHNQGVIHSDLKPSNIFVTNSGEVKLIDFGIARSAKRDDTLTGEVTLFDVAGLSAFTPAYASYEMINGHEPDSRDDIYALAIIIYQLLSGKHPYDRLSAKDVFKKAIKPKPLTNISKHTWKNLNKGLAVSAIHRPNSAVDFVASLEKPKTSWKLYAAIATPIVAAMVFFGLFLHEMHIADTEANTTPAKLIKH